MGASPMGVKMKLVRKLVLPMLVAILSVCVILTTPIVKANAATTTYTVAGTTALCGSSWSPTDTKNDMTAINGGYLKIFIASPGKLYSASEGFKHAAVIGKAPAACPCL